MKRFQFTRPQSYQLAKDLGIPVSEGFVSSTLDGAVDRIEVENLWPVHIANEGSGGQTVLAHNTKEAYARLTYFNQAHLVTKHIPDCRVLSVIAVVAVNRVWIAEYHEKVLKDGSFDRAFYPIVLQGDEIKQAEECVSYTELFLGEMQTLGFRGLCGLNFIFKPGEVYFTYFFTFPQCTVPYVELAMLQAYPDQVSLIEVGKMARDGKSIPEDLQSLSHVLTQSPWSYLSKDKM